MSSVRFFTDEDVYGAIAPALRKSGIDAISTPESARLAETDQSQLEWAIANRRVLVTFNVADFAELHTTWMNGGRHHCGIIVSKQRTIGEIVGRLIRLANSLDAESMKNRLEFLSNW